MLMSVISTRVKIRDTHPRHANWGAIYATYDKAICFSYNEVVYRK